MLGQQLAHTAETMPAVPISILIYTQHGGFLVRESTNIDQHLTHERIFRHEAADQVKFFNIPFMNPFKCKKEGFSYNPAQLSDH